jgi:3-methyl-2-oxobutanoate hydroxymethyltransferase
MPMTSQVTIPALWEMKRQKQKIVALTAYDFTMARMVEAAGIDVILVGDSLGMVVQGRANTLPVTMDEMIYHTAMVARATRRALVVGDMPFMSYQTDHTTAIGNAGRFIKEAGAAAVKLEGGAAVSSVIRAITTAGIPVQAHIGLTPQSVHQMGGYRVQRDADRLLADAREVQVAGAFSVVLEGIPADIAAAITATLDIPTIGIGAGPDCDGQILVLHDLLGLHERKLPRFVKQYQKLTTSIHEGLTDYTADVRQGQFPAAEHCYR